MVSEILVNLLLHDLLVHSVVRTVLTTFARIHVQIFSHMAGQKTMDILMCLRSKFMVPSIVASLDGPEAAKQPYRPSYYHHHVL